MPKINEKNTGFISVKYSCAVQNADITKGFIIKIAI